MAGRRLGLKVGKPARVLSAPKELEWGAAGAMGGHVLYCERGGGHRPGSRLILAISPCPSPIER